MDEKIKKVLVIQLERPGDIILTSAFLKTARLKYEKAQIDFLQIDTFKGILDGADFIDNIIYFPMSLYSVKKPVIKNLSDNGKEIDESLFIDNELRKQIERFSGYDVVYNLAHDIFSLWFNAKLDIAEKHGGILTKEGRQFFLDPWNTYLVAFLHDFRNENRIHLLDMYKACVGITGKKPMMQYINTEEVDVECDGYIALSPGASSYNKVWPPEYFAEISDKLQDRGYKTVLIGSNADKDVCEKVFEMAKLKPLNLCGKTNIAQAAGLIKKCRMLISHDTGTIHMAAAVGTPVLYISCGKETYFRETSPYSAGNYIIQMALGSGYKASDIKPDEVMALFLYAQGEIDETFLKTEVEKRDMPIELFRSYIFSENCDGVGGIGFYPVFKPEADEEAIFTELLRYAMVAGISQYKIGEEGISEIMDNVSKNYLFKEFDFDKLKKITHKSEKEFKFIAEDFKRALEIFGEPSKYEVLKNILVKIKKKEEGFESISQEDSVLKPVLCFLKWMLKMIIDEDTEVVFKKSEKIYAIFAEILKNQAMLISKAG